MGKTSLTEPEMVCTSCKKPVLLTQIPGRAFPKSGGTDFTPAAKNHYELRKLQVHAPCLRCPKTGRVLRLLRGGPADEKSHRKETKS